MHAKSTWSQLMQLEEHYFVLTSFQRRLISILIKDQAHMRHSRSECFVVLVLVSSLDIHWTNLIATVQINEVHNNDTFETVFSGSWDWGTVPCTLQLCGVEKTDFLT